MVCFLVSNFSLLSMKELVPLDKRAASQLPFAFYHSLVVLSDQSEAPPMFLKGDVPAVQEVHVYGQMSLSIQSLRFAVTMTFTFCMYLSSGHPASKDELVDKLLQVPYASALVQGLSGAMPNFARNSLASLISSSSLDIPWSPLSSCLLLRFLWRLCL